MGFFIWEEKVQACEDYLSGIKSVQQIATELNMIKRGTDLIRGWAKTYRVNGYAIFDNKNTNNRYTNNNYKFNTEMMIGYLN